MDRFGQVSRTYTEREKDTSAPKKNKKVTAAWLVSDE